MRKKQYLIESKVLSLKMIKNKYWSRGIPCSFVIKGVKLCEI